MIDGVEQLTRELELSDSENRKIIQAYSDAEVKRIKLVISPLIKRYPSLNKTYEGLMEGTDPIDNLKASELFIQEFEISKKELAEIVDKANEEEKNHPLVKATKSLLNNFEQIVSLYKKFVPIEEQMYIDLAHAVKKVSTQKGVGIKETVENSKYMDEVLRIMIPIKKEAESYLKMSQLCGQKMLDFGEEYSNFIKVFNKTTGEILEQPKTISSTKAMEELHKRVMDYKKKEFDRVYSI